MFHTACRTNVKYELNKISWTNEKCTLELLMMMSMVHVVFDRFDWIEVSTFHSHLPCMTSINLYLI